MSPHDHTHQAGISSFMEDVQHARLARAAKLWQTASTTTVGHMELMDVGAPEHEHTPMVPEHPMDSLAEHLANQWLAQQAIQQRTNRIFDTLLTELETSGTALQQRLSKHFMQPRFHRKRKNMLSAHKITHLPERSVHTSVDGDRSVGMASILWHHLSFTVRSHTRPYAIIDPNNPNKQLLCGRILALNGDFAILTEDNPLHDVPELLEHEVASLYVPAQGDCSIALVDDEALIPCSEDDVASLFVEHCLLMACTGDILHEQMLPMPGDS